MMNSRAYANLCAKSSIVEHDGKVSSYNRDIERDEKPLVPWTDFIEYNVVHSLILKLFTFPLPQHLQLQLQADASRDKQTNTRLSTPSQHWTITITRSASVAKHAGHDGSS
jgi:hypothetical protein